MIEANTIAYSAAANGKIVPVERKNVVKFSSGVEWGRLDSARALRYAIVQKAKVRGTTGQGDSERIN